MGMAKYLDVCLVPAKVKWIRLAFKSRVTHSNSG